MSCYARLHLEALALSNAAITCILQPLDFSIPAPVISMHQARDISKLLLICFFNFGHFQRFMGRIYTGDFLDFDAIDDTVSALRQVPHVPGLPLQDFDRVHHTLHNGFSIKQHFQSPHSDYLLRNIYDDHSSIEGFEGILGERVAMDVQNSFAYAFPHWILRFIHGLTLNAMGIDVKMSNGKTKHRLINDASTPVLGDGDPCHGNVNMQLDKRISDDVPKVFLW